MSIDNKQCVKDFFKYLEEGNAEAVSKLFAKDGKHINPYASGIFPEGAVGQDEIKAYWEGPIKNFKGMSFPIKALYTMNEASMVFVEFTGQVNLKDGGVYSNHYYATFKFNDDHKIVEYVEIFNPIVAARGFGLIDQIK